MKNINYIIIIFILILIGCKSQKAENFIDTSLQPTSKELKGYYKYNFKGVRELIQYIKGDTFRFSPVIYTNIPESNINPKTPMSCLGVLRGKKEEIEYFVEKMNGQYVLYLEKEGKIIMREYGMYYDFFKDRFYDSIKYAKTPKIVTEQQVYEYLKQNNIKYKLISKKKYGIDNEIKIQLQPNGYYTYITFNGRHLISNTYYQPQDTFPSNNELGNLLLR